MRTLFHRSYGPPDAPAIVLLHGLLGSSRNWITAANELGARLRVLTPDLRNHGQSFHDERMDYEAMAEDVRAWLETVTAAPVLLVGHSMGGKVAMQFAERFPERLSGLGVLDMAPRSYNSQAHRNEFAAMKELDLRTIASRADAELRFESRVPDWGMRKFLTTNLERTDDGWRWAINLPALTQALPTLERDPLADGATYAGPVRFWRGTKSNYIRPEDEARIRVLYPQAVVRAIEGAGHNPHMDSRPALLVEFDAWIAERQRAT